MKMKLGILETGKTTPELEIKHGAYPNLFVRLLKNQEPNLEFEFFSVIDGQFPTSVNECQGWLITGSRHGAYEELPWIKPLEQFIRESVEQQVPIVGICFGHQIIAQALGGKVVKSEKGWGLGVHDYEIIIKKPWIDDHSDKYSINVIHQDQVVEVPESAEVIASSEFCPNAAVAYGNSAFTVQGHPEFEHDFYIDLINARRNIVFEDWLADSALSRKDDPVDNDLVAKWIMQFFRLQIEKPKAA